MQNKRFDYIGKLKIMLCISLAIVLVGVAFNLINGTKLDIDFSGGTTAIYSYEGEIDYTEVEKTASDVLGIEIKTSESTDYTTGSKNIVITVVGNESLSSQQRATLKKELVKTYPDNNFTELFTNSVEPTVGAGFPGKSFVFNASCRHLCCNLCWNSFPQYRWCFCHSNGCFCSYS